jgi:hypothetical protein
MHIGGRAPRRQTHSLAISTSGHRGFGASWHPSRVHGIDTWLPRRNPIHPNGIAVRAKQCRISAACPSSDMNPLIIQAPGSPALVKARSPLFPEQFHPSLAGGFCDIYSSERANLPNLRNNSSSELASLISSGIFLKRKRCPSAVYGSRI